MKLVTCILALLALCGTAFAAEVDLSGLTDDQIRQLKVNADQMRVKEKPTAEKAKEYVELGEMIGKALSTTAKEMNIAVNDFAQTPVGKTALVLIVWKMMGREVLHYVFGTIFLVAGVCLWIHFYRRMCVIKSTEHGAGWWIFRASKVQHYSPTDISNGDMAGTRVAMGFVLVGIVAIGLIITWTGV